MTTLNLYVGAKLTAAGTARIAAQTWQTTCDLAWLTVYLPKRAIAAVGAGLAWTGRHALQITASTAGSALAGGAFTLASPLERAAMVGVSLAAIPAALAVRGAWHFRQEAQAIRDYAEWVPVRRALLAVDLNRDRGKDFVVLRDAKPSIHGAGSTTGLLGIPEKPEHAREVA